MIKPHQVTSKLLKLREAHLTAIKHIDARMKALDAREKKYFGSPCRNGHEGLRYAKCDTCVECAMARLAKTR